MMRKYTKQDMIDAYKMYKNGTGKNLAAKTFNIPRTTFRDFVKREQDKYLSKITTIKIFKKD